MSSLLIHPPTHHLHTHRPLSRLSLANPKPSKTPTPRSHDQNLYIGAVCGAWGRRGYFGVIRQHLLRNTPRPSYFSNRRRYMTSSSPSPPLKHTRGLGVPFLFLCLYLQCLELLDDSNCVFFVFFGGARCFLVMRTEGVAAAILFLHFVFARVCVCVCVRVCAHIASSDAHDLRERNLFCFSFSACLSLTCSFTLVLSHLFYLSCSVCLSPPLLPVSAPPPLAPPPPEPHLSISRAFALYLTRICPFFPFAPAVLNRVCICSTESARGGNEALWSPVAHVWSE